MATTVSSLVVEVGSNIAALTTGLNTADSQVKGFASQVSKSMQTLGGEASRLGGAISAIAAPFVGGIGAAAYSAVEFDEAMTNVGAVLGKDREEMAALSAEILDIGGNIRAGPQAAAEAFYDIVGGVQDASTHMAILDAAIATSEAGSSDLQATTGGLISVMNAYGFAADQAGTVSDILTTTVGMGVGTMDQFVAALGPASGLAYDVGVSFEELAASAAFLTSTGGSPSESVTQLTGIMSAFLKPNKEMGAALADMGYESGSAALQALGLAGSVQALYDAVGSTDQMAGALGTQEALAGSIGLLNERAAEFTETFNQGALGSDQAARFLEVSGTAEEFGDSIQGATDKARAIQMESPAAQFDMMKASISELGIEVGETLIPAMDKLFQKIEPIVDSVIDWVGENPELVSQISQVALVAGGLGLGLMAVGSAIGAVGTIAGAVTGVISAVGLPVIALAAGVGIVIALLNDPGIQTGLKAWEGVVDMIPGVMQAIAIKIDETFNDVAVSVRTFVRDIKGEVALAVGQLAVAGQALGLGIGDDVVNNMAQEFATIDIAKNLEGALNSSLATGGPLEFDIAQIRWITSGEAPPELFDKLAANIADPRLINEALGSAIDMGDAEVVDVLAPLALKFADDPKLQMQTLLDEAFTAGGEEGMAFQALVPMATELGIDVPALADQMQAELTAMESEQVYSTTIPVQVTLDPTFGNLGTIPGGATLGVPQAASGANINSEGLVYAHAGERILNPAETASYEGRGGGGGGGNVTNNIYGVTDIENILSELRRRGMDLEQMARNYA